MKTNSFNCIATYFPEIFMLIKKFQGSILSVSVCPSSYFLNLLSEIYFVDTKCSLRQGFVDQVLSRLFWKVQGH
jgi:hypothetical protein